MPDFDTALDDPGGDDLLRLVFTACHPVLTAEGRVALTLRLLGGLTTDEIARAFLVPETTMAQRIVRAKRTLAEAHVPFEVPRGAESSARLASVLEVIYLIFNEGYAATAGEDWMRPALCEDALRLGRIVAELAPREAEVHGLVALMEIQSSRIRARVGPDGEPILLLKQDRTKWDQLLIRRGLAALERAARLGGVQGPYVLQGEIAGCHARAGRPENTDWKSDCVAIRCIGPGYAVAGGGTQPGGGARMAYGPAAGLEMVDRLVEAGVLESYHLLPAVRGDLLEKLGRFAEARAAFEDAARLTRNEREQRLLLERAQPNRRD